jgi:hypothetical protein
MNEVIVPWCREQKLEVTRLRAYKKNDQAFVEQKNGAVVPIASSAKAKGSICSRVLLNSGNPLMGSGFRLARVGNGLPRYLRPPWKARERRGTRSSRRRHFANSYCRRISLGGIAILRSVGWIAGRNFPFSPNRLCMRRLIHADHGESQGVCGRRHQLRPVGMPPATRTNQEHKAIGPSGPSSFGEFAIPNRRRRDHVQHRGASTRELRMIKAEASCFRRCRRHACRPRGSGLPSPLPPKDTP